MIPKISSAEFIKRCKIEIAKYFNSYCDKEELYLPKRDKQACPDNVSISEDDVYLVLHWYCQTLQNHKALLSTEVSGSNTYYVMTYDGDRMELYMDVYKKYDNILMAW